MRAKGSRLYCTFVSKDKADELATELRKETQDKIFILDIGKEQEVVITYNTERVPEELLAATVLCHRHKSTRTIYTINALNTIIQTETGHLDTKYTVDWTKYQDSLLVVQDKQLIKFRTKIINIL